MTQGSDLFGTHTDNFQVYWCKRENESYLSDESPRTIISLSLFSLFFWGGGGFSASDLCDRISPPCSVIAQFNAQRL